jgi:hypothetical protein
MRKASIGAPDQAAGTRSSAVRLSISISNGGKAMDPRRRPANDISEVSITGTRRSTPDTVDGRTPDPGKEDDVRRETYEERIDRAVSDSTKEHPEGSAPPLERIVDSE